MVKFQVSNLLVKIIFHFLAYVLGMQLAVIEIARNVLNLIDANSSEFGNTNNPVVGLMTEWIKTILKLNVQKSDKGGTMRLGSYPCQLQRIL